MKIKFLQLMLPLMLVGMFSSSMQSPKTTPVDFPLVAPPVTVSNVTEQPVKEEQQEYPFAIAPGSYMLLY